MQRPGAGMVPKGNPKPVVMKWTPPEKHGLPYSLFAEDRDDVSITSEQSMPVLPSHETPISRDVAQGRLQRSRSFPRYSDNPLDYVPVGRGNKRGIGAKKHAGQTKSLDKKKNPKSIAGGEGHD